MRKRLALIAAAILTSTWPLASCDSSSAHSVEERTFDEDAARADAVADLSATTYEGEEGSFGCTDDCSGHNAGWEWAAENDVSDSIECGGSGSFQEGCEAYAVALEARVEAAEEEAGYQ